MKLILLIIITATVLNAQSVFEPVNSDVYDFPENISVTGAITFDYELKQISIFYTVLKDMKKVLM